MGNLHLSLTTWGEALHSARSGPGRVLVVAFGPWLCTNATSSGPQEGLNIDDLTATRLVKRVLYYTILYYTKLY